MIYKNGFERNTSYLFPNILTTDLSFEKNNNDQVIIT